MNVKNTEHRGRTRCRLERINGRNVSRYLATGMLPKKTEVMEVAGNHKAYIVPLPAEEGGHVLHPDAPRKRASAPLAAGAQAVADEPAVAAASSNGTEIQGSSSNGAPYSNGTSNGTVTTFEV